MKKNIFNFFVIGVLVVLNISLLWKNSFLKQEITNLAKTSENMTEFRYEKSSEMIDSLQFMTNQVVLDSLFRLKNENDNIITFQKIIKDFNKVLVFRFSESDCVTCYDKLFELLKNIVIEIGCEKIVFWGRYENKREWLNFLKFNPYFCKSYYSNSNISLPAEKTQFPYLFILNSSRQIEYTFCIDKTKPNGIRNYLDFVKNRLLLK